MIASAAGSQFLPQASRAGSAGSAKKRKKVTALITTRMTRAPRVRRTRNLSMAGWLPESGPGGTGEPGSAPRRAGGEQIPGAVGYLTKTAVGSTAPYGSWNFTPPMPEPHSVNSRL